MFGWIPTSPLKCSQLPLLLFNKAVLRIWHPKFTSQCMIANFGCHVYAFAQSCVKLEGILLRIRRRELILENSKHDCKSKYVFYFASWMHSACMGNTGAFLIHDLICIDAFKHLLNIYLQFIDNQTIFLKLA